MSSKNDRTAYTLRVSNDRILYANIYKQVYFALYCVIFKGKRIINK